MPRTEERQFTDNVPNYGTEVARLPPRLGIGDGRGQGPAQCGVVPGRAALLGHYPTKRKEEVYCVSVRLSAHQRLKGIKAAPAGQIKKYGG